MALAIGRRIRSQINGYVKHLTLDRTDDFRLRILFLETEAPQDALGAHTLVVLNEGDGKACLLHIPLAVGLHEIAPGIAMDSGCDHTQPLDSVDVSFDGYLSHTL